MRHEAIVAVQQGCLILSKMYSICMLFSSVQLCDMYCIEHTEVIDALTCLPHSILPRGSQNDF